MSASNPETAVKGVEDAATGKGHYGYKCRYILCDELVTEEAHYDYDKKYRDSHKERWHSEKCFDAQCDHT